MKFDKLKGGLCLFGGTCLHFYLGWFYLWGNITTYITSYLHKHDESITLDDTSIVFVVQIILWAVWMPIAPIMIRYLPPWLCWGIGGGIGIVACFIASFMTNLGAFVFFYGAVFGLGVGIAYLCPIIAGWEYFPSKKGLVSGLVVGGFGFGSFAFSFISMAIANPDNEVATLKVEGGKIFPADSPISSNAPKMIQINCLIWLILLWISLPLLRRYIPPKEVKRPEPPKTRSQNYEAEDPEHPNGEVEGHPDRHSKMNDSHHFENHDEHHNLNHEKHHKDVGNGVHYDKNGAQIHDTHHDGHDESLHDLHDEEAKQDVPPTPAVDVNEASALQSLFSWKTLHLYTMLVASAMFPYYVAANFKSYGSTNISDDQFITIVGAIGSALNGASRIGWATIFDFFGFKYVYMALLLIEMTIAFTFVAVAKVKILYLIWVAITYACLGGHFSMYPSICAKTFGPKKGGIVYSFVFSGFAVTTLVNFGLSKLSSKNIIEYTTLFYILASLCILSFILLILFREVPFASKAKTPKEPEAAGAPEAAQEVPQSGVIELPSVDAN